MAPATVDAAVEHKRRHASASMSSATSKTLLAVHCSIPGRVIPTNRICVDDKVRLKDVVSAWAVGVMKSQGGRLPAEARVVGNHVAALDLDSTLRVLRPQLPVRDGRLTIVVQWPAPQQQPTLLPTTAVDGAVKPTGAGGGAAAVGERAQGRAEATKRKAPDATGLGKRRRG
mmetsp:Transcript_125575/g.390944  ORF Transcript_125575/g.390944 Transcript_125575/m.390944 type:complete len:172 (+) Transcript_125575:85-600(+)